MPDQSFEYTYPKELVGAYYKEDRTFSWTVASLLIWVLLAIFVLATFALVYSIIKNGIGSGQITLATGAFFAGLMCYLTMFNAYQQPVKKIELREGWLRLNHELPRIWSDIKFSRIIRFRAAKKSDFREDMRKIMEKESLAAFKCYALAGGKVGDTPVPFMIFVPKAKEAEVNRLLSKKPAPEQELEEITG